MITLAATDTVQGSATSATTVTYTVCGVELAGSTETVKVLAQGQLATAAAVLYTVPASAAAKVHEIFLSNRGSTTQTVSLYVNGTAPSNALMTVRIPASGSAVYDGRWNIYDQNGNLREGATTTRPWIDVTDYGADSTGLTDSTVAIQAAIDASPRGIVYFPAGEYRISSALTVSNFTILRGAGILGTFLYTTSPTADMIVLNSSGSGVEDMWLWAVTTTTTAGGTLSGTPQTINVGTTNTYPASGTVSIGLANGTWTTMTYTSKTATSFIGATGTGTFSAGAPIFLRAGGYAINTSSFGIITIRDVRIENQYNGIQLGGVEVTVTDSEIYNTVNFGILVNQLNAGPELHNVVMDNLTGNLPTSCVEVTACGVLVISDCQFIRGRIGMRINPDPAGVYSVYCTNSFFDNCSMAGLSLIGANSIQRSRWIGCWFSSSTNGVLLNNPIASSIDFLGCHMYFNSANGILATACSEWSVSGRSRMAGNTTAGVNIAASTPAPSFSITNNLIGSETGGVAGNGTGIIIAAGTYASYRIAENTLAGNTTANLVDNGSVASPNQKQVTNNVGLALAPRPLIATPPTFGAAETVVYQVPLPANSLLVGTTLGIVVHGTISATNPTLLARLRIGTTGTTADTQICASTAAAVATGTGWQVHSYVTVRILGSSGKCLGNLHVLGTAPIRTAQTATVTVNTTVPNFLSLTLTGGGSNPTVTVVNAFVSTLQQQ